MKQQTWREAIAEAQQGTTNAYEHRRNVFIAAHEAGLSYRQIADAAGITAQGVFKAVGGKQTRASLDDLATSFGKSEPSS